MKRFLACYDIEDDGIRDRVARFLGEYGQRVQESVFEVTFREEQDFPRLKKRLLDLSAEPLDIRFYPLCADCRRGSHTLGGERAAFLPTTIIL